MKWFKCSSTIQKPWQHNGLFDGEVLLICLKLLQLYLMSSDSWNKNKLLLVFIFGNFFHICFPGVWNDFYWSCCLRWLHPKHRITHTMCMTEAPDFKPLQHVTKIMLMQAENNFQFSIFTFPRTSPYLPPHLQYYQAHDGSLPALSQWASRISPALICNKSWGRGLLLTQGDR